MTFKELGFQVVRGAISKETAELIDIEFRMIRTTAYYNQGIPPEMKYRYNDVQVEKSFAWYSPYCLESLATLMQPKMEAAVGKKLWPCYSYGRIYYNGAELVPHTDRPGSEYAATVAISRPDSDWPIYFTGLDGRDYELFLEPGDACIYLGSQLRHWRRPFEGHEMTQGFVFYVDQQGEWAHLKYDTRPAMGLSTDTKQLKITNNYGR